MSEPHAASICFCNLCSHLESDRKSPENHRARWEDHGLHNGIHGGIRPSEPVSPRSGAAACHWDEAEAMDISTSSRRAVQTGLPGTDAPLPLLAGDSLAIPLSDPLPIGSGLAHFINT